MEGAVSSADWEHLLRGGTIERPIVESVALRELQEQPDLLWSVLVFTGYLKLLERRADPEGGTLGTLAIPNEEVRTIFRSHFSGWIARGLGGEHERREFIKALLAGDAESVERWLAKWLLRLASYHDTASPESPESIDQPDRFYQGLVLGLLASLGHEYDVRSNPEVGYGRCDILIAPRTPGRAAVVLEFKVANRRKRETLEAALRAARKQIVERDYAASLRAGAPAGTVPVVHELAVAWSGKEVRVVPARPRKPVPKKTTSPRRKAPARPQKSKR